MQHRCDVEGCDSILSSTWNLKQHKIDQHRILITSSPATAESHQSSTYPQRLEGRREHTPLKFSDVPTFVGRPTVQDPLLEEETDEAQEIERNATSTVANEGGRASLLSEPEWSAIIPAHLI